MWESLELEGNSFIICLNFFDIFVFLVYGIEDDKVFIVYGKEVVLIFLELSVNIFWNEYLGFGYWFYFEMIIDIIVFFKL